MQGSFTYNNPTRLHFGEKSLEKLSSEIKMFGPTVMVSYGGGSIKRNGIYDRVMDILAAGGKKVVDDGGVMPNPTLERMLEGARKVRENDVDLILAIGGGSTIDYAKGVSASAYCEEEPWEKYYVRQEEPSCRIVPVGTVLTMVGTGSEMNGGSVITNHAANLKVGKVFGAKVFPQFTILNPTFTYSVPRYQMVAGMFDIMSHIMEQYFAGDGDYTTDYIAEGLMRSLIHSSRIAIADPECYEARANIMWTATWALNTLLKCGKRGDWEVHMIGQAMGAVTDATHGMTLACVSRPYYRYILPYATKKMARFAKNVWDVEVAGKDEATVAAEGLKALEAWMDELGLVRHSAELGVTEENIPLIADGTFLLKTGYRQLSRDEVIEILKQSL